MPVTDLHLRNFLDKLDTIRENLHLRPLTEREILVIVEAAGFTTTEPGVGGNYNPIFSGFRSKKLTAPWKNTKGKTYRKEKFVFNYGHHLTVICDKEMNKKFRLTVLQKFKFSKIQSIQVLHNMVSRGFTSLIVNKLTMPLKKIQKLQILLENRGIYAQPLNINTDLETSMRTPISVKTWVKTKILSKLGVKLNIEGSVTTMISDGSYLYDDVGTISDIEMIEIIKEIELVDNR